MKKYIYIALFFLSILAYKFIWKKQNNDSEFVSIEKEILNYSNLDSFKTFCWCLAWSDSINTCFPCRTAINISTDILLDSDSAKILAISENKAKTKFLSGIKNYDSLQIGVVTKEYIDTRLVALLYSGSNIDTFTYINENYALLNYNILLHYSKSIKELFRSTTKDSIINKCGRYCVELE